MKNIRFISLSRSRIMMILLALGPIIFTSTGCISEKNHINNYSRRDYLPEFYKSSFVLGASSDSSGKSFIREPWPSSPEATRHINSSSERTYENSYYSYHSNSHGRPQTNFSYRIVTSSVK